MEDLFATHLSHRFPVSFSQMIDPMSGMGQSSGLCLHSYRHGATSPAESTSELKSHSDFDRSVLAPAVVVSRPLETSCRGSCFSATMSRSTPTAAFPSLPSEPLRASSCCLVTHQQSARHFGFSRSVARQLTFCCRKSTRVNYQAKWLTFCAWCRREGHLVSCPSLSKVSDFLLYLRRSLHFSYSSIAGYHSMLSLTFCY